MPLFSSSASMLVMGYQLLSNVVPLQKLVQDDRVKESAKARFEQHPPDLGKWRCCGSMQRYLFQIAPTTKASAATAAMAWIGFSFADLSMNFVNSPAMSCALPP